MFWKRGSAHVCLGILESGRMALLKNWVAKGDASEVNDFILQLQNWGHTNLQQLLQFPVPLWTRFHKLKLDPKHCTLVSSRVSEKMRSEQYKIYIFPLCILYLDCTSGSWICRRYFFSQTDFYGTDFLPWEFLLIQKLEIEKTKTTFIISVLTV